MAAGFIFY